MSETENWAILVYARGFRTGTAGIGVALREIDGFESSEAARSAARMIQGEDLTCFVFQKRGPTPSERHAAGLASSITDES